MTIQFFACVSVVLLILMHSSLAAMYSSRLIHRFSNEMKALTAQSRQRKGLQWPEIKNMEYYQMLLASDFRKQKMRLGSQYQLIFPSEGSQTVSFGNELGWLYYTWVDIGTPNNSFLVALDDGADLFWVPCDCIQCAPLSAAHYSSLDKDLNEYSPGSSSTSKNLNCSHQLCELGAKCKSSMQPCPYNVQYYSVGTSTSGLLVEDVLHLSASNARTSHASVQASVIIGCGKKQSGGYLDGIAPDGLMGLGLGEISVPSFLAKSGLVHNSFSLCFDEEGSGTILFGDQGPPVQRMTPFLPLHGKYSTYIVGIDACCVGKNSCLEKTSFQALIDSGTSFTFLPDDVYQKVVHEFDGQVNATRASFEGYPWKYCYKDSVQAQLRFPSITFILGQNNTFKVHNPIFPVHGSQGIVGYCLAIQPSEGDVGRIGQNFLTGYRLVFDREHMKFGWSGSDCQNHGIEERPPLASPPHGGAPNSLPTDEEQLPPSGHAVVPVVAGKTHSKASAASALYVPFIIISIRLLPLFLPFVQRWRLRLGNYIF